MQIGSINGDVWKLSNFIEQWIIESGPALQIASGVTSSLAQHTIIIQPVLARRRERYRHRIGSLFTAPTSAGTSEEMDLASPKVGSV